jgi:hypothetical protein
MTAAIVPFRTAAQRQVDEALAAIQRHTIRETRRLIFECRQIRAESAAVRRGYLERQQRIEALLARIHGSVVEGEGG